jgi:ABC-2 type transport system permease protein
VVPLYFAADAIRSAASQVSGASAIFLALFVLPPPSLSVPPVYGFVGIVAPLLGVAFAFDAINGERSEGTLPRLVSQPIHRDDVITGKFIGGLAVIMLVLVSVVLVIAGFGIVRLGIVPAPSEILRVVEGSSSRSSGCRYGRLRPAPVGRHPTGRDRGPGGRQLLRRSSASSPAS